MKRKALAFALILALLVSVVAGTLLVRLVKANGYPPTVDTEIEIDNPQNKTYTSNTITLKFYVWEAFSSPNFFYSLDGQEMKAIENMTLTNEFDLNAGKNPSVVVANLRGSFVLSNLTEGRHNVTIYQIGNYPTGNPLNGEVINSASIQFMVATPQELKPFPTTLVATASASVAIVGVGLLVYFKKHHGNRITDDDKQPFQKN
jgi:hypothetical protein